MEPEKNNQPDAASEPPKEESQAPVDALSRTPEDLQEEQAAKTAAEIEAGTRTLPTAEKKVSPLKKFLRKINLYLLIFIILIVVTGAVTLVNFLNSQKPPEVIDVASQSLSEDALKQLANSDTSVGNTSQTLTIQGNAIIAGQTLMRGNLNVAGNIQSGGRIQGPSLTVSGESNLGSAQINTLQVAANAAVQGNTTLRDLNVAGASTFSGAITASEITVSRLILSGNGVLQIPNHISFTGPAPTHTTNTAALGSGGSVSLNGSDTSGTININTGNGPAGGCFSRITFRQAFTGQARVIVSPVGAAAGQTQYYVDRNNSGFSICTVNAAQANQSFSFDYFVAN